MCYNILTFYSLIQEYKLMKWVAGQTVGGVHKVMDVKIIVTEPSNESWSCWSDRHALFWFLTGFPFNSLCYEEIIPLI